MNNKKAAVYILLGQSNAVGHGIPMEEKDIINTPLKNVFGLHRDPNQSFDTDKLVWSNYTSYGMNLAEEQDNTYSVGNCLAQNWQNHIDSGNKENLPDLYIIQIAIGAQAVTPGYMWYPKMERKLIPGKLGTVNISLYSFACHIFSLLDKSFKEIGKEYEIIGLHWRGGSNDITEETSYLKENLFNIYCEIFDGFNKILNYPPTVLHLLFIKERCFDCDSTGKYYENMLHIDEVFEKLAEKYSNVSLFDVRKAPQYIEGVRCNGIYIEDAVHFTPEVNNWVSTEIMREYIERA